MSPQICKRKAPAAGPAPKKKKLALPPPAVQPEEEFNSNDDEVLTEFTEPFSVPDAKMQKVDRILQVC